MRLRGLLLALLIAAGVALPLRAQSVIADLSDHLVAISTGFVGVNVLLFGAMELPEEAELEGQAPGDVVVVVRGPEGAQTLHRKAKVAGIWMNTAQLTFERVPSFYAVASTRPLDEIAADTVLAANGIGLAHLDFDLPAAKAAGPVREAWRQGLIRAKQREGLYVREAGAVSLIGETLFRSRIYFPTNVPTGLYQAQVYLFRGGQVASAQVIPLSVSKVGLEAEIFDFAHDQAGAYGLIAVLLALVAGWLGHAIFRRD
jgi:uncharacterized protein (TIGR02186 family)